MTRYYKFCQWHLWRLSTDSSHLWKFGTNFSHLWRVCTNSSHLWAFRTDSSHLWKIEYQFFTGVKNWYQFFILVKIKYQFFTSEKNRTSPSQMARMRTNSSQLKWERCEIWAQMLDPQNYRNWPYANFTFSKSEELVPILHTVWNLWNVKFTVQQGFDKSVSPWWHIAS